MNYLFEDLASTATKNTKRIILLLKNHFYSIRYEEFDKIKAVDVMRNTTGINVEWSVLDYFEYLIRDMYFHGSISQKYEPGAARILIMECNWNPIDLSYFDSNKAEIFRNILQYINDNEPDAYDQYLNNDSFYELYQKYEDKIKNTRKPKKVQTVVNNSDYTITEIKDFESSRKFWKYTNPKSRWCLTFDDGMFNMYLANGRNRMYFCYVDGFETMEKPIEPTENLPLDEYGLSLICLIIKPDGTLRAGVTRWNHDKGGGDESIDYALACKLLNVADLTDVCPANDAIDDVNAYKNKFIKIEKIIADYITECKTADELNRKISKYFSDISLAAYRAQCNQEEYTPPVSSDIVYSGVYFNDIYNNDKSISNYLIINLPVKDYETDDEEEDDDDHETEKIKALYDKTSNKIIISNLGNITQNGDNNNCIIITRKDEYSNLFNLDTKKLMLPKYAYQVFGYTDKYAGFFNDGLSYIINKAGKIINKKGISEKIGYLTSTYKFECYGNYLILRSPEGLHTYGTKLYNLGTNKVEMEAKGKVWDDRIQMVGPKVILYNFKYINIDTKKEILNIAHERAKLILGNYVLLTFADTDEKLYSNGINLKTGELLFNDNIEVSECITALDNKHIIIHDIDCPFYYDLINNNLRKLVEMKKYKGSIYSGKKFKDGKYFEFSVPSQQKKFYYRHDTGELNPEISDTIDETRKIFNIAAYLLN